MTDEAERNARGESSGGRGSRLALRVGVVVTSLVLAAGQALAHTDHSEHAGGGGPNLALPAALLAGGGLVLGTSVYLDRSGELDGRLSDLGVLLGIVGLLAGLTLAFV